MLEIDEESLPVILEALDDYKSMLNNMIKSCDNKIANKEVSDLVRVVFQGSKELCLSKMEQANLTIRKLTK